FHRYRHGERAHLHQSRQCRDRSREDTEQAGLARNRLISPDLESGTGESKLALESFMNRSRFPLFSPSHLSLDCALNRLYRPLSLPDRKFSLEKEVGIRAAHLATQECFSQPTFYRVQLSFRPGEPTEIELN